MLLKEIRSLSKNMPLRRKYKAFIQKPIPAKGQAFSTLNTLLDSSVLRAQALSYLRVGLVIMLLLLPIIFMGSNKSVHAAINQQLHFQGRLRNSSQAIVPDGDYNLRFKIYSGGDGALGTADETLEWTETYDSTNQVRVENGYFAVQLGQLSSLSTVDFSQDTLWLSIEVGDTSGTPSWDGEMDPFIRLSATPYAFQADNSDTLDTLDSSAFGQLSQDQTWTGINTFQPATDSTTAFQVLDQDGGNPLINVDTTNSRTETSNLRVRGRDASINFWDITATYDYNFGNSALRFDDYFGNRTLILQDSGSQFGGPLSIDGNLSLLEGSSPSDDAGYGKLFVNSTDSALYFRNDSGTEFDLTAVGTCDSCVSLQGSTPGTQQTGSINVSGTIIAGTAIEVPTLTVTGGTTASRPASPSEGQIYFDTDTDTLLTYAGGKWQADRGEYIVVAASDSTQAEKDSANYVTDGASDQTEINNALIEATGGKVYLLPGIYTIGGSIQIPGDTMLAGSGSSTVIKVRDNHDANLSVLAAASSTEWSNIVIRDLRLDGNKANNVSGSIAGVRLAEGYGGGSSYIVNVIAENFLGSGIVTAVSNSTITNSLSRNNTNYGFSTGSGTTPRSNNSFTNNIAESNESAGFYVGSGSSYNTFSGNTSRSNSEGFELGNSTDISQANNNTFTGNTVYENNWIGFSLANANRNIFSGNTLYRNGDASWSAGFYLGDDTDSNSIVNNNITPPTTCDTDCYAIYLAGGGMGAAPSNTYLSGNVFSGGTVEDQGTATTHGGQLDGSGNYTIDSSGNIELQSATNVTGDFTASGAVTFSALTSCSSIQTDGSGVLSCGAGGSGVDTIGDLDGGTANANGATVSGTTLYLQSASATYAGLVNTGTQTFAGAKTFSGNLIANGNTTLGDAAGDTLTVSATSTFNGNLTLASGSTLTLAGLNCTTGTNGGALTTDASGNVVCSDDDGGTGGSSTIQEAYTLSTGGTVPEIKLDTTRGGLDIQDSDSTIGGNLFSIRGSNATGLGTELFTISSTGRVATKTTTDATDAFKVQNSADETLISADTQNMRVGIGTDSPSHLLHTYGGDVRVESESQAWGVSTSSFSQSISTQDTSPRDIAWNNDGTKLYEVGSDSDLIYEYTVATPYDISTASFSQSISTQDTYPRGITWNNDGTKLYEVGSDSALIYEYTVATPYDISTASFSQSIGTQNSGVPETIIWNNDGTKLYEVGNTDVIYESNVSTPWDISTASLSQSIATQDSVPTDIAWSDDGTKLYEVGYNSKLIYESNVSTPWDISTAVFSVSISAQDGAPMSVAWSNDGTKMFETGWMSDYIYESSLAPPTGGNLVVDNTLGLKELSASPGAPSSGFGQLYVKTDGKIYFQNDDGTEHDLTARYTPGGDTKRVRLSPEYSGGTLSADGSDNTGVMIADHGNGRNYYEWTSSNATTQDYDIIVSTLVPSDYASGPTNFYIANWRDSNTNASATITIDKEDGTSCLTSTSIAFAATASTWNEHGSISLGCSIAAHDILLIKIKMQASSDAKVRMGAIRYDYVN